MKGAQNPCLALIENSGESFPKFGCREFRNETMEYTGTHLHPDPISDSPGSVPSLLGSGWWLQLEVRTDAAAESALSLLDFDHHALQLLSRAAPFVAELQNLHCSSLCVCARLFLQSWELKGRNFHCSGTSAVQASRFRISFAFNDGIHQTLKSVSRSVGSFFGYAPEMDVWNITELWTLGEDCCNKSQQPHQPVYSNNQEEDGNLTLNQLTNISSWFQHLQQHVLVVLRIRNSCFSGGW